MAHIRYWGQDTLKVDESLTNPQGAEGNPQEARVARTLVDATGTVQDDRYACP